MKLPVQSAFSKRLPDKPFLIVKFTVVILLFLSFQVRGQVIDQNVSYSGKNVSLETVFAAIKKQTGYLFIYKVSDMQAAKKVTVDIKNLPLQEALRKILQNQSLQFTIEGNTIVISQKPEAIPESQQSSASVFPVWEIRGQVVDSLGLPLPGASVTISGTESGTVTDSKGNFILTDSKENTTVHISFTGYISQDYRVRDHAFFTVTLERKNSPLDQVQVIAYGTTTERLNVGSVTTVRSDEIKRQPVADVLQAMQSNVPGLEISQASGVTGTGYSSIHIRGVNSISSGSNPLFLIDGVQVSGVNDFVYGVDPFSSLSPSDIESVSVLKDADATAIYGSRGANGVILVTTKKGKAGATRFNANIYTGVNSYAHAATLLNTQQYLEMRREAFSNDGVTPNAANAPDLTGYGVNSDINRYTNWQKAIIGQHAYITDADFSVSGGDLNTTFMISAALHHETPPMPGSFSYNRPSLHFNVNHSSQNKRFNITLSGNYSDVESNFSSSDYSYFALLPPNLPQQQNPDGSFNFFNRFSNPYASLAQPMNTDIKTLVASGSISYKIAKGLEIRSTFGYTTINWNNQILYPLSTMNPAYHPTSGSGSFQFTSANSWQVEPQIEYEQKIGIGNLTALLGATYQGNTNNENLIYAQNYSSEALLEDYSAANNIFNSFSYYRYKYLAAFARLNYNIEDKILFDLTARRDGSSRFGPGKQFGNFGAAGAGWIFSKEQIVQRIAPWLSFGKLRASYGITGNDQIGDYKYLDTYGATVASIPNGGISAPLVYDGVNTLSPSALFNPDYGWETTRKLEFGLDIGFIKDRILLYVSRYSNRSSSQLINYSLAPTTGFSGILSNLPATIGNKGWEFTLNTVNVQNRNFGWRSTFNISLPKNTLLAFPDLATSSYANSYVIGQPISIHKVFKYLGVDPQTGLFSFADASGKATANPIPVVDQQTLENTDRKYYGGFTNIFSSHAFQLTVDLQFVKQKGMDVNITGQPPGALTNFTASVLDRWQKPGDITTIQRFTQNTGSAAYNAANYAYSSERAYIDASFMRIKNVALSYDFSASVLKKVSVKSLRVYVNAQNLLTITSYNGNDPESAGMGQLPVLRSVVGGIQCTF